MWKVKALGKDPKVGDRRGIPTKVQIGFSQEWIQQNKDFLVGPGDPQSQTLKNYFILMEGGVKKIDFQGLKYHKTAFQYMDTFLFQNRVNVKVVGDVSEK